MTTLNMAKGLIPHPPVVKKLIGWKPEGVGWDDLGPRSCKGIVLHRMQGTLGGTYAFFGQADVAALTDFGISSTTGEVWQYNDPFGRRSGWASGTVNQPYGDGKAFVDTYGVIAVNRDQISVETDLYFAQPGQTTREDPVSDDWRHGLAAFIAPYAHDYGIPYDVWPIAPQDGFSFIRWHQEFTIGTGKVCPGEAIMAATDQLIEDVRAILRHYQTGGTSAVSTPVASAPTYARPDVPTFVQDATAPTVDSSGTTWRLIADQYRTVRATPRLRYADPASPHIGPDIPAGVAFGATYIGRSATDGKDYLLSPYGSRIRADDCERISDVPPQS